MFAALIVVVLFLAFANGANDNFKGVATLHGSGRASFSTALLWATITTAAGSLAAIALGSHLQAVFSGKGLVPAELVGQIGFVLPVATGAAATVLFATLVGLPISTTHALIGGLVGAGLAHSSANLGHLATVALLPLLLSPLVALLGCLLFYSVARRTRQHLGITKSSCVCARDPMPAVAEMAYTHFAATAPPTLIAHREGCDATLEGTIAGLSAQRTLDLLHFLSAGAVGFARGLNDTPKIVALLLVGTAAGLAHPVWWVAAAMAVGGLLAARRVARTLSHGITTMNDGQGFAANFVTAGLVLFASKLGMPVSTTHVSVGAIFGIGAANAAARRKAIVAIIIAWLVTLPLAGVIAAATAICFV